MKGKSDLKQWHEERWMFSGHVAGALKMIRYHRNTTALSPTEEEQLDKIEECLHIIKDQWDASTTMTRVECLMGYRKKRKPKFKKDHEPIEMLPCYENGHKYQHTKYVHGKKQHPDWVYSVRVCKVCGNSYYYPVLKKNILKVVKKKEGTHG